MSTKQRKNSLLRRGVYTTAVAAGLMLTSVALRAQETTTQPTQQPQGSNGISLNVFNTTQSLDNAFSNQLAVKAQKNFGNDQSIWFVGGKQDKISAKDAYTSGYDFGLKYAKGTDTWVRTTYMDNFGRFSYGVEGKVYAFSIDSLKFSFLGDLSSQYLTSDVKRHTNGGGGVNLNFLKHENVFATYYSDGLVQKETEKVGKKKKTVSSEVNRKGIRSGWVYTDNEKRLLAFVVDSQDTQQIKYSAFGSLPFARLLTAYDPNTKIAYTQAYLTFGMGSLSDRTLTSQVLDQFVYKESSSLTRTGLADSDNTKWASTPKIYFLNKPEKEFGEYVSLTWNVNPSDKRHNDVDVYGVTALRRTGLLFTENVTKDTLGEMHYGGGIGIKLWKYDKAPSFVFVKQSNNSMQGSLVFSLK